MTVSGVKPTYASAGTASSGDTFTNDGRTLLHIKNGGASATTVTVVATTPCNQGVLHDDVVSIPAGEEKFIGFFDTRFNDATGKATVKCNPNTSVTLAVIKAP